MSSCRLAILAAIMLCAVASLCLSLHAIAESNDPACVKYYGRCGDANFDRLVNVSDAVYMIQYIFGGGPAPDQLWRADLNLDEHVTISDVVYLINYVFAAGSAPCSTSTRSPDVYPLPFRDCLQYSYDGDSVLSFKHINAGFNCCPLAMHCDVSLIDQTIVVHESEEYGIQGPCNCLCLFSPEFSLNSVPPGTYTISVEEIYDMAAMDTPLEFQVVLSGPTAGEFCVYRGHYPWGSN